MSSHPQPLADQSAGDLVARMSRDLSELIRDELRLAQAETIAKGKKAGRGVGIFGGAGVLALYGAGTLIVAAVLALATTLHAWLAAVIVGVALLASAGGAALVGRREISAASPPVPTEAIHGVKEDVAAVREAARR